MIRPVASTIVGTCLLAVALTATAAAASPSPEAERIHRSGIIAVPFNFFVDLDEGMLDQGRLTSGLPIEDMVIDAQEGAEVHVAVARAAPNELVIGGHAPESADEDAPFGRPSLGLAGCTAMLDASTPPESFSLEPGATSGWILASDLASDLHLCVRTTESRVSEVSFARPQTYLDGVWLLAFHTWDAD